MMGIKLDRWTKEEESRLVVLRENERMSYHHIAEMLTKEFDHFRNPRNQNGEDLSSLNITKIILEKLGYSVEINEEYD